MSVRVVFMGSPDFALPSLRSLVEAGYQVVGVYTQPDKEAGRGRRLTPPPAKVLAESYGLRVLQPPSLRQAEAVTELASLEPEVIVVAAHGQILRQVILDIPPRGVINVHPSLLPRHRGASPVATAILCGDGDTGVTIMLADAGMDTGPILSQRSASIDPLDTTSSLTAKLATLGADLLLETLPLWLSEEITPQPQEEASATSTTLVRKEDGQIDWSLPATVIWRQVRAYNPWPGTYTYLDGALIHIWQAWLVSDVNSQEPGAVVPLTSEQENEIPASAGRATFGVQTGEGVLAVLRLQRAGRRALTSDDFLRGQQNFLGRRLGR